MNTFARTACALSLAFFGWAGAAQASVQVVGTRVIYPAEKREVTVNVLNNSQSPRLLQAWIDSGNEKDTAETAKAPFMVTPPMARIDPGKGQSLRVIFTGTDLPQDRESVFWLNVLDIPPMPKAQDGESTNFMQFAIRSRLKIFYRPKGLPGSPVDAHEKLTWRLVSAGGGQALECSNTTAFNVSLGSIGFKGAAQPRDSITGGGMCPAKGKQTFPMRGNAPAGDKVVLKVIDDYGGMNEYEASYAR